MESSAELTASCQCFFAIFHSYKVPYLSCKIISANLKISCFEMQPVSGNQRRDLLTSLMNWSLVLRLPPNMHLCRPSLKLLRNRHMWLTFGKVPNPLRLPHKTALQRPKVVQTCGASSMLTSKCASCQNGLHFFHISTSKNAPTLRCFAHFDFEMCCAPQSSVLFPHLNFQKCTDTAVFCTR